MLAPQSGARFLGGLEALEKLEALGGADPFSLAPQSGARARSSRKREALEELEPLEALEPLAQLRSPLTSNV